MKTLRPVQRRSAPDEVADQLVDGIVTGDLPAGDTLPSERDLADRLGVSRPTVRSALARLSSAGLVETRQGGGSTVRDFRRHAGLDLLPRLLFAGGVLDLRVVRDVLGTRTALGPQVAALAAEATGSDDQDAALLAAAADVGGAGDATTAQVAAITFWDALVDRGASIVFRLLYNQLRLAVEPAVDAVAGVLSAETDRPDLYDAIAAAVLAGDAEEARDRALELLQLGEAALTVALTERGPSD